MKRVSCWAPLIAVGGLSLAVSGQAPGPSAKAIAATKIEKVKDNLYIITGSAPRIRRRSAAATSPCSSPTAA